MRRALAGLLVGTLILSTPTPVRAYLKFGVSIGGVVRDLRWTRPIRYFVNERAVAGVTAAQFRDAIGRAFATWQSVPSATVQAELAGPTVAAPGAFDGRTTLGFLDRPDLDRVLGATSLILDASTGEIVEADVFFNTRFDWSVAPAGETGRVDLESVALHEIGHLLGLGHSALGETELLPTGGRRVIASGAVMFPIAMSPGSIADRVLQSDDVAGVTDIYSASDVERETGSISGRVTLGGRALFGAHVVAFSLETGVLVANFSLGDDGRFVIAGLEPGPYLLRVEPLDDAEPSSFFARTVDTNFQVTHVERIVVAPGGGSSEEIAVEVRPR
jgi:hypothetical protein